MSGGTRVLPDPYLSCRRSPEVATGLAGYRIPELAKRVSERDRFPTDRGEASYGNNFLADMVKTDDFRGLPFLKMTTHCITNLARQLRKRVCFGKNGFSEGARGEPSLRGLFDHENQFIHRRPLKMLGGSFCHIIFRPLGNVQRFLIRQKKLAGCDKSPPACLVHLVCSVCLVCFVA